jgi:hypothetical protein
MILYFSYIEHIMKILHKNFDDFSMLQYLVME